MNDRTKRMTKPAGTWLTVLGVVALLGALGLAWISYELMSRIGTRGSIRIRNPNGIYPVLAWEFLLSAAILAGGISLRRERSSGMAWAGALAGVVYTMQKLWDAEGTAVSLFWVASTAPAAYAIWVLLQPRTKAEFASRAAAPAIAK